MTARGGEEAEGLMELGTTSAAPGGAKGSCDRGQGAEGAVDLTGPRRERDVPGTAASCDDGAAQEPSISCSNAIREDRVATKRAQKFGYCYKRRRFSKDKTAVSSETASSSKRTPNRNLSASQKNRDLSDQLEARAHRLLRDAGWSITPRIRNDRPKMSFYFAAPQRVVVVHSLAQAWKFCGQMLHAASGSSERRMFPRECSGADQFWRDLVTTMDYAMKMTIDGENSHTLLRQWQFLDPFVAVVFIDKRITALQKQKTLVAVNSSTRVADDGNTKASGASCSMHQNVQCCQHCSNSQEKVCVKPQLCCTQNRDSEVANRTENHFQSSGEPGKINCGQNIGSNLVKRVRKKSKWLSDFESTGLNGLYARSFTQPTVGLNESGSCSTGSRISNIVAELCHTRNATVVECNTSPEAEVQERSAIKTKSECWEAKKRPSEIDFSDDDLLITVIVKKRDMGSFHKSTSQSVYSKGKFRILTKLKERQQAAYSKSTNWGFRYTGWKDNNFVTKDCVMLVDCHWLYGSKRCYAVPKCKE